MNRSSAACSAALGLVLAIMALAVTTPIAAASPATRYVDVSVATVWASRSAPRAIDRPALANPVQLTAWSQVLTTAARLGLVGRIETQALLGEPVRVLGTHGAWTHVAVPDQSSPKNRLGYPGWMPTRQLTSSAGFGSLLSGRIAIVIRPTGWLRSAAGTLQLSFGTRLPVVGSSGADVTVATPAGGTGRLPLSAVALYPSHAGSPGSVRARACRDGARIPGRPLPLGRDLGVRL